MGHQGAGRDNLVALGGEEVEELLADFGAFHRRCILGPGLHVFHVGLALFQPGRFLAGEGAALGALVDALLLVGLALIHLGRDGLGQQGAGQGEEEGGGGNGLEGFHGRSPDLNVMGNPHGHFNVMARRPTTSRK